MNYSEFLERFNEASKLSQTAKNNLKSRGISLDDVIRGDYPNDPDGIAYLEAQRINNEMYNNGYVPAKAWETLQGCQSVTAKYPGISTITGAGIKPGDMVRMKNVGLTILTRAQVGGSYVMALDSEF